jgi:hypothetical protein
VEKLHIALQRRSKEMQSVGKAWPRKGKAYQREAKEERRYALRGLCVAMIALARKSFATHRLRDE